MPFLPLYLLCEKRGVRLTSYRRNGEGTYVWLRGRRKNVLRLIHDDLGTLTVLRFEDLPAGLFGTAYSVHFR